MVGLKNGFKATGKKFGVDSGDFRRPSQPRLQGSVVGEASMS